ncbi:hypothetical protein [Ralstonia insidiosa]|jgi:hypothetical protein|nr:hypothetical protein [Ralstonia insidiosa]MBA9939320.1 hypothetical protein [Ralstonia insidiosa]MBC9968091.1 hypothetical protein [Ralstonia insidiosa]MBX3904346.1 hypothetical protein [Ralstonia insidiosa]
METQYGGRTANQLRDLLAGAESAQASIEAMLGGGVNAITVFRDLLTAAEGRDAQAGSAQAQLIASGTVTPQQAAGIESAFNACSNREACREMLARERAAADMPSHGLDGRVCEHCGGGHTELTFEDGQFSSNCDMCCADNDFFMVEHLNQLVAKWVADQKGMPQPDPAQTGVGVYCQPGDRRNPRWLLVFDDADRGQCNYDNEQNARRMFAIAEGNGWNCWLLSPTLRAFDTTQFIGAIEAADLAVDRYALKGRHPANPTLIQRCPQAGGADKWKVQRLDECLNKHGEWEPEPLPSNRDAAYLARCRFDSDQAAIEAAITAEQKENRAC